MLDDALNAGVVIMIMVAAAALSLHTHLWMAGDLQRARPLVLTRSCRSPPGGRGGERRLTAR